MAGQSTPESTPQSTPKYPYPANLNIANFVSLKLSASNYLLWETQVLSLIESQDLLGFITGKTPQPEPNGEVPHPDLPVWTRTDRLVKAWITATISEEALGTVVGLVTSAQVWKALTNTYSQDSEAREFELLLKLQQKKKEATTLDEYIREFKLTCDHLNAIGKPVPDRKKVFWLLSGLGSRYESFSTAMLKPPVPTYNDLIPLLHSHELIRASSLSEHSNPTLAFVGERSTSRYQFRRGSGSSFNSRGRGFNPASSRPPNNMQRPYSRNPNSPNTNQCQICKKRGHEALKCWYRFDNSYQDNHVPQALAALHITSPEEGTWHPDSAATAHITDHPGTLSHIRNYKGCDSVMVGNGEQLTITHTGQAHIFPRHSQLSLHDVLVVPDIKKNLISIPKLTTDYPCCVIFDDHGFLIKDLKTNQVLASGSKKDGLYVLDNIPAKVAKAFFSNRFRVVDADTWHGRLGHPQSRVLNYLQHHQFISVNKKISGLCKSCALSKSSKLPFFSSNNRANAPLVKIHCDLWGPATILSNQGFRYYVILVDDFSRFSWIYPLKNKSDFYTVFIKFQAMVEKQFHREIEIFHSDQGGEFSKQEFLNHLAQKGIIHHLSCPGTPEQNSIAERKHRHVVELGLAMMLHASLPKKYWVESFLTAVYLINRLPSPSLEMHTPYSLLYEKQPAYDHFRTFGCQCYPYLRHYMKDKLEPRSLSCIFMGYSDQHKGYHCLHIPTGRVYISRHVVFDELKFPFTENSASTSDQHTPSKFQDWLSHSVMPTPSDSQPTLSLDKNHARLFTHDIAALPPPTPSETPATGSNFPPPIPPAHQMTTRSRVGIVKPNPKYALTTIISDIPRAPTTTKNALQHPGWYAAMLEEIKALHDNQTWVLVPRQPSMNVIGCKWVYRPKIKADGSLDRLKARLVAKGYNQREGVDFLETFSPVIRPTTIRTILTVATVKGWNLRQLDVKNAFLHGFLTETVFMEQPPGFRDDQFPDHVCLLKRSLYGLRQSPRTWFDRLSSFILDYGFHCSVADPSMFVYRTNDSVMIMLIYVDDIVLTGSNTAMLDEFVTQLGAQFAIQDLGDLHYFLGIQVQRFKDGIFLSQSKYMTDLLNNTNMADCKPVSTPMSTKPISSAYGDAPYSDVTYYRKIVGTLQYLSLTRPDIAFAVNVVCQFMHAPTNAHFMMVKRILRYLKGTISMGLRILKESTLHLYAFSDADWAGCPTTRRSTTGYCTFLGSNCISWSAKKQPTVSRSSAEAEYRSLASTTAELTWVSFILRDIGIYQERPQILFCDNISALHMTVNPVFHSRTKHIAIDYHFVREKVALGTLTTQFVPSAQQVADIFTKPLSRSHFDELKCKLGLSLMPRPV